MGAANHYSGKGNAPRRKNIFISYREKDTAAEAGRLADSLKQHFYNEQIFMDIDKIEPGVDFTDVINHSLASCDVMLAVIGPNWATLQSSTSNTTRIKDPNDWVRLEIATALERKVRVVPVLVDGVTLPSLDELPEDLHALVRRQAYEISNKRWKYDTDNLAAFLQKSVGIPGRQSTVVPQPSSTSSSPVAAIIKWGLVGLGLLFIILMIVYAVQEQKPVNPPLVENDTINKPDPQPIHNGGSTPVRPPENETGGRVADQRQAAEEIDISGIWDDANGLYYMVISHDEDQLSIVSYSLTGQKTGDGFGTVNGRNINFRVSIINFGIINANAKVTSNGSTIQGTTTVEANGQVLTEPLVLRRR